MPTLTRALVGTETGVTELLDLELADVVDDEVLVQVEAVGICHTDLVHLDGSLSAFPLVAGHECSGVVAGVGPRVERLALGDHVVVSAADCCGRCAACERGEPVHCLRQVADRPRLQRDGSPVAQGFGIGGYAQHLVVRERRLVPVPGDVPLEVAAVTGCAVVTGLGAVATVAGVQPGDSVAVIGCGAIGAASVLGAVLCGADRIVAVDPSQQRRERALALGATHACPPDLSAVLSLVPGGVDASFEAAGRVEAMRLAIDVLRRDGTAVLSGVAEGGAQLEVDPIDLVVSGKRVVGGHMGGLRPGLDFDRWFRLYLAGRLPLDRLVTARYPLDEAATALDDARSGRGLRTLLLPQR